MSRRRRKQSQARTRPNGAGRVGRVKRRRFLVAVAALVAGAGLAWLFGGRRSKRASEPALAAPDSLFPPATRPVLFAFADAIVPRHGGHPAASEVDLVPHLERWARADARRRRFYQREWERFAVEIRRRVAFVGGRPEPEALVALLEHWYAAYRTEERPDTHARFFEQLRRDVLRVYYASPAGWASVGYAGPVHRTHPMGESRPR